MLFKDVAIEFFFGANQRLNATLESKSQERVFPRHELVEFLDPLRLRSQKVIVLQQFNNLNQKIRMRKVDAVARSFRAVPQKICQSSFARYFGIFRYSFWKTLRLLDSVVITRRSLPGRFRRCVRACPRCRWRRRLSRPCRAGRSLSECSLGCTWRRISYP